MKTKNNYVTKSEFKSAITKIDNRFETIDDRLEKIDQRFDVLEIKIQENKTDMRELLNEWGELIINKFDRLGAVYLTKKEYHEDRAR